MIGYPPGTVFGLEALVAVVLFVGLWRWHQLAREELDGEWERVGQAAHRTAQADLDLDRRRAQFDADRAAHHERVSADLQALARQHRQDRLVHVPVIPAHDAGHSPYDAGVVGQLLGFPLRKVHRDGDPTPPHGFVRADPESVADGEDDAG